MEKEEKPKYFHGLVYLVTGYDFGFEGGWRIQAFDDAASMEFGDPVDGKIVMGPDDIGKWIYNREVKDLPGIHGQDRTIE